MTGQIETPVAPQDKDWAQGLSAESAAIVQKNTDEIKGILAALAEGSTAEFHGQASALEKKHRNDDAKLGRKVRKLLRKVNKYS